MINNILADSITRIKNGYTSNLDSVDLKRSNYMVNIIKVLYNEGFIWGYHLRTKNKIVVYLKYSMNNTSIIRDLKLISRPSWKIYCSYLDLLYLTVYNNGIFVLSTSSGLMSSVDALKQKLGGKLLFYVI